MEVICDHAGTHPGCSGCPHELPHSRNQGDTWICGIERCSEINELVQCIPVATKKDLDDLLVRLKDQITGIKSAQIYDTRMNQILIMEALVALLEAR